jgi:putative transposase
MRRAFKYRIWTNKTQDRALSEMLETHRRLYNACLEERKRRYEEEGVTVTFLEQRSRFKFDRVANPFYAKLPTNAAYTTMDRLELAFKAFFRRLKSGEKPGYPRFKGRDFFDSMGFGTYPHGAKLDGDRLYVQHIGDLRVKLHRPVEGAIKTLSIKRESDKWYAVFSCDLGDVEVPASDRPPGGIDLGLSAFVTDSDGDKIANPRFLKKELPELRRLQRSVARKIPRSSNRRKAVARLRALHVRVKNLRKESHHQMAIKLLDKFGLIAAEKLDIRELLAKGKYSRSISDAGWSAFLLTLKSKAEKKGVRIVEVEPRGTSQGCSGCGEIVPKTLFDRIHACPKCGLKLDRDHNAARNILRLGLAGTQPVGPNGANRRRAPRSLFVKGVKRTKKVAASVESAVQQPP